MWIEIPHKKHKTAAIIAVILILAQAFYTAFLINLTVIFLVGRNYLFKKESWHSYTVIVTLRNFFFAQFIIVSLNIHSRFKALNQHLLRALERKSFNVINLRFGVVFSDLCDSIELLNETFTLPFVFSFACLLIYSIFAAFGVIKEIMQTSTIPAATLYLNSYCLISYLSVIAAVCWNGALVTSRANSTIAIAGKIMNKFSFDKDQKAELVFVLTQMRSRNLKVENFLFVINWNSLLTVSL